MMGSNLDKRIKILEEKIKTLEEKIDILEEKLYETDPVIEEDWEWN